MTDPKEQWIEKASETWPNDFPNLNLENLSDHPLEYQLKSLLSNKPSSLPIYQNNLINWYTFAPNLKELEDIKDKIDSLCVPSFAWEKGIKGYPSPSLAQAFSPDGYYKWQCPIDNLETILKKLKLLSRIEKNQPEQTFFSISSLTILRQKILQALAANNHDEAKENLSILERSKLEIPLNVEILKIKFFDKFAHYKNIVESENVISVLQSPITSKVRSIVIEAFHHVHLRELEDEEKLEESLERYREVLHPKLDFCLPLCKPDSLILARTLGYWSKLESKNEQLNDIATSEYSGDFVIRFLSEGLKPQSESEIKEGLFREAIKRGHVEQARELAREIKEQKDIPEDIRLQVQNLLSQSYQSHWSKLSESINKSDIEEATKLIQQDPDPLIKDEEMGEMNACLSDFSRFLEDKMTDPNLNFTIKEKQLVEIFLTYFEELLCNDKEFPRDILEETYISLLEAEVIFRTNRTNPLHHQIVFRLSEALFEINPTEVSKIINLINRWCQPIVYSNLSHILDLIELIHEKASDFQDENAHHKASEELWLECAQWIHKDPEAVSSEMEKRRWKKMGERIGLEEDVEDWLGFTDTEDDISRDPIKAANLNSIAIVTLQPSSAEHAKKEIESRCESSVHVYSEGLTNLEAAQNADVVLFVWRKTKHEVYRTFDNYRDKLVYVPGSGSTSIIQSLETRCEEMVQQ